MNLQQAKALFYAQHLGQNKAKEFIDSYAAYLNDKRSALQTEFDEL